MPVDPPADVLAALADAVAAARDARAHLAALADAAAAVRDARAHLETTVATALAAGVTESAAYRRTGLSRATVHRIAMDGPNPSPRARAIP